MSVFILNIRRSMYLSQRHLYYGRFTQLFVQATYKETTRNDIINFIDLHSLPIKNYVICKNIFLNSISYHFHGDLVVLLNYFHNPS